MLRIPEPELMDEATQAKAYAEADFSESHNRVVAFFREIFPSFPSKGSFLDLGCGPGDVTIRFARAYPEASLVGVDGAQAMLDIAAKASQNDPQLRERLSWICSYIPSPSIPETHYDAIISNSLLHHLHEPLNMWRFIAQIADPNTYIFITDLRRPDSIEMAHAIVTTQATHAPEILQKDFFNSLCASFTIKEVETQLASANLEGLNVVPLGEIHLAVYGSLLRFADGTRT